MDNTEPTLKSTTPETLAILSGKGGSGKTAIALTMARILSEASISTLVIDLDTATHGATYFFEKELGKRNESIMTLANISQRTNLQHKILKVEAGFHFIPSTLSPETSQDQSDVINLQELRSGLNSIQDQFRVIIYDCQAGVSMSTVFAAMHADRKLIVLEPDAVSSSSLRTLSIQLGSALKRFDTWQLFNKLTEEERAVYEQVFGGTLFSNLPPIPFDWRVRAAYALGQIPGMASLSSAFGLGVLRIMKVLFPSVSRELEQLEEQSVGDWYRQLADKVKELSREKESVMFLHIERARRRRLLTTQAISILGVMIGAFTGIIGVINERYPESMRWLPRVAPVALGGGIAVISAAYAAFVRRTLQTERAQDFAQRRVSEIDEEVARYRTLLSTDPRLAEYARKWKSDSHVSQLRSLRTKTPEPR